jgi:hypothetical protein
MLLHLEERNATLETISLWYNALGKSGEEGWGLGRGRTTQKQEHSKIFIPASSSTAPTSRMSLCLAGDSATIISKHVEAPENV